MKRLFNTLLIVGIVLLAILFATLNDTQAALDLFFWQTAEHSLASWLIIAFLLGLIGGGSLVYLNMWFQLRRKLHAHRQQSADDKPRQAADSPDQPAQETPKAIAHD